MGAPEHPAYETPRQVTPFASVVLCENPGMMELDGTNTWILRAPGRSDCVVVDPGPKKHRDHLRRVAEQGEVVLTLITHRHRDHTGAIKRFHAMTGAPVRARTEEHCRDGARLADREVIEAAGLRITVLTTPGHTGDSVSFLVEHVAVDDPANTATDEPARVVGRAMVTGDTILGSGTTVLDPTDGTLRDYMNSLNRLIVEGTDCAILPGHGPDHPDLIPVAQFYKRHREERIDQIRSAIADLGTTPEKAKPMKLVRRVYRDVDKKLWPAARMSVKAQLQYLREA
ncbi:MBL fold metallo-hydrolase [Williamsia deligens]|uniref:MBL fold metallo-hydrolase n=1 Tax=Williamsia deligens TaxID=321325 RepID=A0ABW3GAV6_9NOCA|nr:MBL fold metallo-hydrolase [Williamsia deligens]MCP2193303.1 Glyoxylase, beta-lactamase superfamily II [Williamsia deligens]